MRDRMRYWAPRALTVGAFLTIVYVVSTGPAANMGASATPTALTAATPTTTTAATISGASTSVESLQTTLSFSVYRETVEPIFLEDRGGYGPGVSACVTCHVQSGTPLKLQPLQEDGIGGVIGPGRSPA
jgi:hypothetical protein